MITAKRIENSGGQMSFNPIHYGFRWTDDGWYEFDELDAKNRAWKARAEFVKELRKDGFTTILKSSTKQLISRGGIGSGRPHIELLVRVYCIDYR